jgi:hypothetical protein
LLAPAPLLELAVRTAVGRNMALKNPWTADSGILAAAVARRLGIPGWVALRRLGEDSAYDIYAEEQA